MNGDSAGNSTSQSGTVRTVAIIPAYNEERFVGSVVLKARRYVDVVIVVDDGSSDDTAEVAQAAGATVLRHTENRGKGAALNTGFAEARRLAAQAAVVLDADGQHRTREIRDVLRPVLEEGADLVVGSRFLSNARRISRLRVLGMRGLTFASNIGSGLPVTDSQTGFRAFSKAALDGITFNSNGFSVESEMQFLARQLKLKVVEVPISARYPDAAKRSMWRQGLEVLNGILRLIGQYRPLLFFGLPGLIALLAGLWWGYRVVVIYQSSQQLAVGYTLLAVLLCIAGSLSLSTGIILHSLRGLLLDLLRNR